MKSITNSKVNRWKQLIEYDIEKLEIHLDNITAKPLDNSPKDVAELRTQYDRTAYRYELAPATKEAIQRQIAEDREILSMLNEEIGRMTFQFGFKGAVEEKSEPNTNPLDISSLVKKGE